MVELKDTDQIIFRVRFVPRAILRFFNLIKRTVLPKMEQRKSGMVFEDIEGGVLQIYKNRGAWDGHMRVLRDEARALATNPGLLASLPSSLAGSPLEIPFPPRGISLIFTPVTLAARQVDYSEALIPYQNPAFHIQTRYNPKTRDASFHFPSPLGLLVFLHFFNKRYI